MLHLHSLCSVFPQCETEEVLPDKLTQNTQPVRMYELNKCKIKLAK